MADKLFLISPSLKIDIFRVKIDLKSHENLAQFLVGPVEVLIDVPFDAGCYKVLSNLTGHIANNTDIVTPAWCVTKCLQTNDTKRFACNVVNDKNLDYLLCIMFFSVKKWHRVLLL